MSIILSVTSELLYTCLLISLFALSMLSWRRTHWPCTSGIFLSFSSKVWQIIGKHVGNDSLRFLRSYWFIWVTNCVLKYSWGYIWEMYVIYVPNNRKSFQLTSSQITWFVNYDLPSESAFILLFYLLILAPTQLM